MALGEYNGAGSGTTKVLFRLNGNANDSSGNAKNGTATNITYITGRIGSGAASFNGTSSQITFTSDSINNLAAGTISLWVKRNATAAQHSFVDKLQTGVKNHIQFMYEGVGGVGNDKVRWRINDQTLASSAAITDTTNYINWIGTWSASGMNLYKNGLLDNSNALNAQLENYTTGNITMGQVASGAWLNGYLDEVIASNYVWTAAEVKKYYTYAKGRFGIL